MKRSFQTILLLLSLSMITQSSFADTTDSTQEPNQTTNLPPVTNVVADTVQEVNDSIARLKIDAAIQAFYDSNAVAAAKAHPLETIYKYEWKWGGTWEIHPFVMSLLIIILIIISFYAAMKTTMLRDSGKDWNGESLPAHERRYSYSRVQLFWWTMIILICFVLFFLKTWCLLPFNITCIVLLGLGAVVHVGGRIIDQKDLDDVNVTTGMRKQDDRASKRSFFKDLLTDGTGVSVHRFQSLVFNLVFGIGFISFFAINFAAHQYPFIDFSEWQLAMLGVSSATYLGIKATENSATSNRNSMRTHMTSNKKVTIDTTPETETEEPTKRNPADFEQ